MKILTNKFFLVCVFLFFISIILYAHKQSIDSLENRLTAFETRINVLIDEAALQTELDYDVQESSDRRFKDDVLNAFLLVDHEINDVKIKLDQLNKHLKKK